MKIHLVSLGCPKNQVDGETMLARMVEAGHQIVASPELADVIVVNTCGFIRAAQRESVEALLEAVEHKNAGTVRHVIAAGCLAQRNARELLAEIPELDAALGTGSTGEVATVLDEVMAGSRPGLVGPPGFLPDGIAPRVLTTPPWTAYLKVSEGCDNRCAYCAIPDLRGPHRSRPLPDLVAEARQLSAAGVREITLVGQDLTRWGSDLPGRPQLPDLLKAIAGAEGPHWLRLHYLHPARVDIRLLETMAAYPSICHYLDLPMQHGSDRVLGAMGRGTTAEHLRAVIAGARRVMPDVAIRSSFIVGFPGETAADFQGLRRFIYEVRLDWAGVFAYSREEGTPAGRLTGQVPAHTKIRRRALALALQRGISRSQSAAQIGRRLEALVEGRPRRVPVPDGTVADCVSARSYREAPSVDGTVQIRVAPGQLPPAPGTFVWARVFAAGPYDLYADTETASGG